MLPEAKKGNEGYKFTIRIEGENYTGPKEISEGATIQNALVFISSLPLLGNKFDPDPYGPTVRTIEGQRGYVIGVDITIKTSGIVLSRAKTFSQGSTPEPIHIPDTFLYKNRLKVILPEKDKEVLVEIYTPENKQRPQPYLSKPWPF